MNNRLFLHIADIIQRHRTWVRVLSTNNWISYNIIVDGHLKKCPSRVLTLKSFRVKYGFLDARVWHIPEYDLSSSVVALVRKDPSARVRVEVCRLTIFDVEYIIEKASFGIIKLELDKYEL